MCTAPILTEVPAPERVEESVLPPPPCCNCCVPLGGAAQLAMWWTLGHALREVCPDRATPATLLWTLPRAALPSPAARRLPRASCVSLRIPKIILVPDISKVNVGCAFL